MIRNGIAELVEDDQPGYETATAEPFAEHAVMPRPIKRGPGRPPGSRNKPKE